MLTGSMRNEGVMPITGSCLKNQLTAVAVVLMVLPLTGCSYNRFVTQEEAIKAQWAQVQNQLQRRNDLIPNLVETVKGYAQHEQQVFSDIAAARSKLLAARSPEETIAAANQQSSALGRLLAVVAAAHNDGTWLRLKACPADDCQWAYYDRSRNRSAVWCDMGVCGNRQKVRSFRERTRPPPAGS